MAENTTTINDFKRTAEICSDTNSDIGKKTVSCSGNGTGRNIVVGVSDGADSNIVAGSSYGVESSVVSGSSYGAESNVVAGSSYGAESNVVACSSYGAESNVVAGSSYGVESNIVACSSYGVESNTAAVSSYGARSNVMAGSRTGICKEKEAYPDKGTGGRAIATKSKCTEKNKMKDQREHKLRLEECSNNDTGTGIHNIVNRQTSPLVSGVVPGQTIYGTETEVLKLCDEFEDNTVHKGVILNNYAGQIHVPLSKKIYEAGKDYIFENNKVQKGYFGSVYVCIDKTNRSTGVFVIKDIDLNNSKTDKVKVHASLRRELKALIYCRHENIVKLIGLIKEQGHIKVLLEHGGDPLLSKVKNKALDQQKLLKWFIGLLSGISFMHVQSCVHCDLHIGNLLIDPKEELKICDLGSAKLIDEPLFTVSHGYTACYFPPSVLKHYLDGKNKTIYVRVRIDLYATGKLLLEIVSGRGGFPITVEELKPVIWSKGEWSSFLEDKIPKTCSKVIQSLITSLMGYTSQDGFSSAHKALEYIYASLYMQNKIDDDKNVELPSVTSAAFPERIRHQSQEEPMDTM